MSIYDNLQPTANALLAQFKQGTVTLNRVTFAASDVSTPWLPGAQTTETYSLSAVVQGVKKEHLADTLIQASDLIVTCAVEALNASGVAVDIDPKMEDGVVINGRAHEIKKIQAVPPSGTPIVFRLFVRG